MANLWPIHLTDGDGKPLRCVREDDGVVCGSFAEHICENCGPLCNGCAGDTDNHCDAAAGHDYFTPAIDESRYPLVAVLCALKERRITPEYGIARLRKIGAAEFLIDTVMVIERQDQPDYTPLLKDVHKPFPPASISAGKIGGVA